MGQPERDFTIDDLTTVVMTERPHLICIKHGHKWSVKALYREGNKETEVLLDRYLGTA